MSVFMYKRVCVCAYKLGLGWNLSCLVWGKGG